MTNQADHIDKPLGENSRYHIVPPCDKDVQILKETEEILVVSKPDGLLSVPGRHPENKDCVATRLAELYGEIHMAHRLDMSTSGLMVVAKNKSALRALNRQFEKRLVAKQYVAVVLGGLENPEGTIELPLICDWPNRPKQKVDFELGKPSTTHYRTLQKNSDTTRLLLTPITGRSHQLRVHCAEIGHPIIGCELYGTAESLSKSSRLLLHASRLCFDDPSTGERHAIDCPPDF